jgi:hypothetical protein
MQRGGFRVRVALAAVLLLGGGTAVLAQGAPGAYEQLLAALVSLQQSVNAIGKVSNVAVTPMVVVGQGDIGCFWVNVASAPRTVEIQLISGPDGTVVFEHPAPVPIDPGKRMGIGVNAPRDFSGHAYCRFTVVDGTKADIRANLTVTPPFVVGVGLSTTTLSVTAE